MVLQTQPVPPPQAPGPVYPSALDIVWDTMNKYHIIEFEKKIQNRVLSALSGSRPEVPQQILEQLPSVTPAPPPSPLFTDQTQARSTTVAGFYRVTGPTEVTFFATTSWPGFTIKKGWLAVGVGGLIGTIRLSSDAINEPGTSNVTSLTAEPYNWKFTLESDTSQYVEGTRYATGVLLFPPEQQAAQQSAERSGPAYGFYYVVQNRATFYFTAPPPEGTAPGWFIVGLPVLGTCQITELATNVSGDVMLGDRYTTARIVPIDDSVPANTTQRIYVRGGAARVVEPKYVKDFVPGTFTTDDLARRKPVTLNPMAVGGKNPTLLRNLGEVADTQEAQRISDIEVKNRGLSAGSVLTLFAQGPQDEFMSNRKFESSPWLPEFKRHTNFSMYQRVIPFPPPNPVYAGQTIQLELRPTVLGHLMSNMYFKCTIPRQSNVYAINENIGRALIKQVDLMVNEQVIETLYDDWYIIRDQMFLDADEQLGMFSIVGGLNSGVSVATSNTNIDIVCPLEFFFCRRNTHKHVDRERLRKPYFPLCAMWNQKLYVRFTFHPVNWWSNATTNFDFINPQLITEEILLENSEKLYYQNTPLRYIVPIVKKESTLAFSGGAPQLQLTANFPVQSIFWFFRNKNYESLIDSTGQPSGLYYDSRYNYGYTTDYIQTGVTLSFPSSNNIPNNYVDVIDTAKITLNNVDILSTFQGSLYYSFKQPMEHGMSVPSRNIYTYSFGLTPTEYNQGGFLDFSKLNSQTSTLTLVFNTTYASQIIQGYNLYLFYYGYTVLDFRNGFARLPFS